MPDLHNGSVSPLHGGRGGSIPSSGTVCLASVPDNTTVYETVKIGSIPMRDTVS